MSSLLRSPALIRIAILDRRPASRAGIEAVLREQPDLFPVGSAATQHELWPLLGRTRPDVVVIDDRSLIGQIRARIPRPKIVLYVETDGRTPRGADGLVGRTAELRVLLDAIRGVVHAERLAAA